MATSISARCWWRAATPTSSTSRASRPGRSPSAAPRSARCVDVAGLMRSLDYAVGDHARSQDADLGAAARGDARQVRQAPARRRAGGVPRGLSRGAPASCRASTTWHLLELLHAREGGVRAGLRGREPAGLDRHPAARPAAPDGPHPRRRDTERCADGACIDPVRPAAHRSRGAGRRPARRSLQGAGPARHLGRPRDPRLPAGRRRRRGLAPQRPLDASASSSRQQPDGLFEGSVDRSRALSAAHPLAGRGAGDRGSLFLRPGAGRSRPASVQRGPPLRAGQGARRQRHDCRGRAGRALRGVGAQCRARRRGRRLQLLGLAPPSDAAALSRRRLGAVRSARLAPGARYKFDIVGAGGVPLPQKADPLAQADRAAARDRVGRRPRRSRSTGTTTRWMAKRAPSGSAPTRRSRSTRCMPARGCASRCRRIPTWDDTGRPAGALCRSTWASRHLELLPITEHPFGGSWGYQPLGLFAPTGRFGAPEAFARFVDRAACRAASASSSTGCRRTSRPTRTAWRASTARRSTSISIRARASTSDWNTFIYNFGRREVQGFLIASALHWLEHFHVDGLRVDAVASMLYRDYSRRPANGSPTSMAAARTSRRSTSCAISTPWSRERCAGADDDRRGIDRLARRHRSRSPSGGLGFAYKWNMGWMHDTLALHGARSDPSRNTITTSMTFGLIYAFSENFILPLVHDEVVHGKGSLIGKMPGDRWQKLRQPARLFRLHVGPSRQEAAVHGRRDRPGARMEPRRRARLAPARRSRRTPACSAWCATSTALYRRRAGAASARRRADGLPLGDRRRSRQLASSPSCACGADRRSAGPGGLQHDAGAAARLPHRRAARRPLARDRSTPIRDSMAAATWAMTAASATTADAGARRAAVARAHPAAARRRIMLRRRRLTDGDLA